MIRSWWYYYGRLENKILEFVVSNKLIKGSKTNHLRADNALIENGSSEPTNTTTLFELRDARTNFSAGVSEDKHQ